jgi:putative membrane protein insertion efficiency factor
VDLPQAERGHREAPPGVAARFVDRLIAGYQRWLSPALGAHCRFHPTCSSYAREAISRFGLLKGGRLALWRILRCQPMSRGGFDPVPDLPAGHDDRRARRDSR